MSIPTRVNEAIQTHYTTDKDNNRMTNCIRAWTARDSERLAGTARFTRQTGLGFRWGVWGWSGLFVVRGGRRAQRCPAA